MVSWFSSVSLRAPLLCLHLWVLVILLLKYRDPQAFFLGLPFFLYPIFISNFMLNQKLTAQAGDLKSVAQTPPDPWTPGFNQDVPQNPQAQWPASFSSCNFPSQLSWSIFIHLVGQGVHPGVILLFVLPCLPPQLLICNRSSRSSNLPFHIH